jgi:3-hydroxy acid dehydrogenase/malonic semialdehyde reductase
MIRERTSLEGKRVLVTGGTTGIGRAIVLLLAQEGAKILTLGRNKDVLEETLALAEGKQGKVFGLTADVAEKEQIKYIFSEVDSKLGGIDILIANAGISADPLDETSEEDWRYAVETNLVAYMSCAKASIDRMKTGDGGHLIFVSSISAELKSPGTSVYATTKAGVDAFAETLRKEVADKNIRVSSIQPGSVKSDMQELSPEEQEEAVAREEMLAAEEIAEAVQFILTRSPRCDIVNLRIEPRLEEY